jgi:N-acetyl-anhydromuramyl-L-alanine amidase AmpD
MEEENRQTCKIPSICGDLTRWQSLSGNTIGIEIENLGPVSKYDDGMYHNKFGVLDTDTPFKYEGKLNGVYRYEYWDEYTPEQLEALKFLVEDIRSRWDIPKDNVVRHSDLQSKNDPGPALDEWMEINGYASLTK